jgi:hypothetical protein
MSMTEPSLMRTVSDPSVQLIRSIKRLGPLALGT